MGVTKIPTAILDNSDIIRALNYLTNERYEINTIINKKINSKGEIEIFWSYKK